METIDLTEKQYQILVQTSGQLQMLEERINEVRLRQNDAIEMAFENAKITDYENIKVDLDSRKIIYTLKNSEQGNI